MEKECLLEEVTPKIKKILKPIVKNMNTSFRIDISYTPETGLVINTLDNKRSYRRSTDESDTDHRSRTSVGRLRVTYPDGHVIEHKKASRTLFEVVEAIGFENVEKLNWTVTSQPFVSRQAYPHRQLEKDGWYVTTHSSTPFKKKQIEDLSKKFKLRLKVEIV